MFWEYSDVTLDDIYCDVIVGTHDLVVIFGIILYVRWYMQLNITAADVDDSLLATSFNFSNFINL